MRLESSLSKGSKRLYQENEEKRGYFNECKNTKGYVSRIRLRIAAVDGKPTILGRVLHN